MVLLEGTHVQVDMEIIIKHNGYTKELWQGYRKTTNNRMELLAVIVGLESRLKETAQGVTIYSDSKYVINAIEKGWLKNWIKINFKHKKKS